MTVLFPLGRYWIPTKPALTMNGGRGSTYVLWSVAHAKYRIPGDYFSF